MPAEGSFRLSRAEHARIFGEKILPRFIRDQQPQAAPVAVLLGGQPGIGESSSKSVIVETLQADGGVVDFSAELLRSRHPRFAELLAGDERSLAALDADIDQDARAWVDLLVNEVVRRRLNAIVDSDLASPDRARGFIDRFGGKGYRMEVQFVAGPAALSRLGALQRFQDQLERVRIRCVLCQREQVRPGPGGVAAHQQVVSLHLRLRYLHVANKYDLAITRADQQSAKTIASSCP